MLKLKSLFYLTQLVNISFYYIFRDAVGKQRKNLERKRKRERARERE